MTPCSVVWDWSRLDGNMGVGKSNFNINNFWWDLCQRLWDWTWIKRVDYGLSWAQGVVATVGFRSHIENLIIGHFEGLQTYTSNFTILYIQKASVPVKCVWKEAFFSGITENWQQYYWSVLTKVSVIILRGLFKVRKSKLICCICQHLHAIIIFALSVS